MRSALLTASLLTLAACQQEPPAPEVARKEQPASGGAGTQVFAGPGRDRLCLASDGRAGFVSYAAQGDANCSVRGTVSGDVLTMAGADGCRIPLRREGERVTLGDFSPECSYYCGPGASFANKTFVRMDSAAPATDFGGDPLC